MNKQQVLERAIQRAIDGGYCFISPKTGQEIRSFEVDEVFLFVTFYGEQDGDTYHLEMEQLIFNHDFAKALWGDHCWRCIEADQDFDSHFHTEAWQYHLQQMVIAEDPIKYLEEHAC